MKNWIVRRMIDYCCKKALNFEQRRLMLKNLEGVKFIYALGSNIYERDRWLRRIEYLQKSIGKE